MYVQQKFVETRADVLQALMRAHPLGAFVMLGADGLEANHMPFHLDVNVSPHGTLRGHMPKSNPVWQNVAAGGPEALVIFQGPNTYITPSWYPSKHAHGQAVPTWNYAVVHAYGRPTFIHDRTWLLAHVTELTNMHEATQKLPWHVSDAPADYVDKMLELIVGVDIPLTRVTGKWKVSQNRPPADRLGVAAGLTSRQTADATAMEELVTRYHGELTKNT